MRLKDKVVLVTGSTTGIGEGIVRRFVAEGAKVIIQDGLPENWPDNLPPHAAPSGRILSPAVIAATAVYWVGDESVPVSGTVAEMEQYPVLGRLPNVDGAS